MQSNEIELSDFVERWEAEETKAPILKGEIGPDHNRVFWEMGYLGLDMGVLVMHVSEEHYQAFLAEGLKMEDLLDAHGTAIKVVMRGKTLTISN